MKRIIFAFLCLMALSSCKTLLPGVQIVSNPEAAAPVQELAKIIAVEYVKVKYADDIQSLIKLSDTVLNAPTSKDLERAFNEWKDSLADKIKDPTGKAIVKAIIASYDIRIDGTADLDWGGRDKAIRTVKMFRDALAGTDISYNFSKEALETDRELGIL